MYRIMARVFDPSTGTSQTLVLQSGLTYEEAVKPLDESRLVFVTDVANKEQVAPAQVSILIDGC